MCVFGAEGGRWFKASGSRALAGPRPPAAADQRGDTPSSRQQGPRGRRARPCVPRRRVAVLARRRLGVRPSQTSRNCRCPLATLCPPLKPAPSLSCPVPRPGDSSLGRGCSGEGAAHRELGLRLRPRRQTPAAARNRDEGGRRGDRRVPEAGRGLTRRVAHGRAGAQRHPRGSRGLCEPVAGRAAPRSPGGGTSLGRRGDSCGERFTGM